MLKFWPLFPRKPFANLMEFYKLSTIHTSVIPSFCWPESQKHTTDGLWHGFEFVYNLKCKESIQSKHFLQMKIRKSQGCKGLTAAAEEMQHFLAEHASPSYLSDLHIYLEKIWSNLIYYLHNSGKYAYFFCQPTVWWAKVNLHPLNAHLWEAPTDCTKKIHCSFKRLILAVYFQDLGHPLQDVDTIYGSK